MTRLFLLAATVLVLAALSACNDFHWITPIPPLPSVVPTMAPEPSLLPTITPTSEAGYKCARWRVRDCELELREGEM